MNYSNNFENFADRHIGPRDTDVPEMLKQIGVKSIKDLILQTIPK